MVLNWLAWLRKIILGGNLRIKDWNFIQARLQLWQSYICSPDSDPELYNTDVR